MQENLCLVSLGSNTNSDVNIAAAQFRLIDFFGLVYFSSAVYTEPIGMPNRKKFLNQVAQFKTHLLQEDVVKVLKSIEKGVGRDPKDKVNIVVDLDLLRFNGEVLKPDDMERQYIKVGIEELNK